MHALFQGEMIAKWIYRLANFSQTWHKAFLHEGDSSLQMKNHTLYQRDDSNMNLRHLELIFSPEPLGQI